MRSPEEFDTCAAAKLMVPALRPEKLRLRSAPVEELLAVDPVERNCKLVEVFVLCTPPLELGAMMFMDAAVMRVALGIVPVAFVGSPFQFVA